MAAGLGTERHFDARSECDCTRVVEQFCFGRLEGVLPEQALESDWLPGGNRSARERLHDQPVQRTVLATSSARAVINRL